MAASWERTVNTTIRKHLRDEEVAVLRNHKLLAMLSDRGRISYGHSGDGFDWPVQFRYAPMLQFGEMQTLSFPQQNLWKKAVLEWRGYAQADSMTKGEFLKNRGTEAIVKVYEGRTERMMRAMKEQFAPELYVDGNASGNTDRIHGFDSFTSVSGASSDGFVGSPNDTYASLVCTLGNYGGAATGVWPGGTADPEYDFWAPLVVDYTDTSWAASTKTWPNTCLEALSFAIIHTGRNDSLEGTLDLIILARDLYREFIGKLNASERANVKRGDGKKGVYALGFTDVINWDGVDVTREYAVPQSSHATYKNNGYGFNIDQMELYSQQSQLFVPEGPTWSPQSQAWLYSLDFYGNMRFESPRYFCKFKAIT